MKFLKYFFIFLSFFLSCLKGETFFIKDKGIEIKIDFFVDIFYINWNIDGKYLPFEIKIFEEEKESFAIQIKEEKGYEIFVASIETENVYILLNGLPFQIKGTSNLIRIELPDKETKLSYVNEYIERVLDYAKEENRTYGTPISISISQSALETGWGQSQLCLLYNNYFGLMYPWGNGSPHKKIGKTDSNYNIYENPIDSFLDHGWGLRNYSRYSLCWNYTNDPDKFIKEVRKGGYSTDEMYSQKVIKIMQNYNLYHYDEPETYSTNFKTKNLIITTDFLNIREEPAGNLITLLSPGSEGEIIENSKNGICKELDGKNWIWWNVKIKNKGDGQIYTGWCSEHRLEKVRGDINEDGEIDISDVILCLRMAISLDLVKYILADINKDGEVDITDVILILRKAIGLDIGRTFYVSPTGDNSNPGTFERPWATPGFGSRQLQPGDTLIILGGRYSLSQFPDDIITPPSGTQQQWITIKGEEGNRPVLVGRDNLLTAIDLSGCSYVRIENLEITSDNNLTGESRYFREGIQILNSPASHIILKDIYIHHIDEFGIDAQDVDDLQILNCRIEYCGFGSIGGPRGEHGGLRNIIIRNCHLSYSGHYYQGGDGSDRPYDRPDGFGIEPSNGPILIEDTIVEHNYGDGIDSKAANTTIRRCIVANNSCDGVKLWGDHSRIENTLIYGRGDGDPTVTPWSPIVIDAESPNSVFEIVNVTVDDALGENYLMHVQYDHPLIPVLLTIKNTIFCGRGNDCPIFIAGSSTLTLENNLFYMPNSAFVLSYGDNTYTSTTITQIGTNNIYGDPLFVHPSWGVEGDYHLQQGSPAIDRGTSVGAPDFDIEGKRRPNGNGFDIGAYEM